MRGKGELWIGTDGSGIYIVDRDGRQKMLNDSNSALTNNSVMSLERDNTGRVWIATGEGLVCYDPSTQATASYSEDDGLPNNTITNILGDNSGNLWLSTLNGLSRFNIATEEFKNYYHFDGIQENEFHACASYKDKNGKLYFGGINGLTSFYPHIVDQRSHPVPPISLSRLTILNENTEFSVEELSHAVGMSRVHLNRKLKEIMNISPSNLIRSIRLKQAAYLLINNKVNISEVAYKVGFSTHSYFSNSFHDYFGMTPKEFVTKYADCSDKEMLKKIFE